MRKRIALVIAAGALVLGGASAAWAALWGAPKLARVSCRSCKKSIGRQRPAVQHQGPRMPTSNSTPSWWNAPLCRTPDGGRGSAQFSFAPGDPTVLTDVTCSAAPDLSRGSARPRLRDGRGSAGGPGHLYGSTARRCAPAINS